MAEETRAGVIGRRGPPAVAALCALAAAALCVLAATPLRGQDPPRTDTLEVLPDSVRGVFADTLPPRSQRFPDRLLPLRGPAHEVFECDRECVHASTAFSLIELLLERVPGMTALRGGFFAGPHHALDGAFGPGFVALYVDGREILSLERAQADLRRLSLNYVERVRVFRAVDGLIIDVDLIRHDASRAYSRIGGGTGNPRAEILDGVFANGLGRAFNLEGSFELLDINDRDVENDRFAALGRLSWMPRSNDFGVQFEFHTAAVDRSAVDTADVRRTGLVLRTRGNLGERAQLEAYAQTTNYRLVVPGLPDSIAPPQRGADGVGLRLAWKPGAAAVSAGVRFAGGDAYASRVTDITGWVPLGPFTFEGGAELASWNEFSASSLRAGVAFADTLIFPVRAHAFAAAGDRGIGFPELGAADSVGFDAYGAVLGVEVGPFDVVGRVSGQRLDRQIGFGGSFDRAVVVDSSEVDLTSLEARVEGPLIPLGLVLGGLEPIRIRAWWRQNTSKGAATLYVPERLARAELMLHDTFFEDNLEIWLSGFVEHRGARLVPMAGSTDPVLLGSDNWAGGQFMFKIGDFRFFWRFSNPGAQQVADLPGATFPLQVNVFGLRWEFFN